MSLLKMISNEKMQTRIVETSLIDLNMCNASWPKTQNQFIIQLWHVTGDYTTKRYTSIYHSSEQYWYNARQAKTFCKHVPRKNEIVKIASYVHKRMKIYHKRWEKDFLREIWKEDKETALQVLKTEQRSSINLCQKILYASRVSKSLSKKDL